MANTLTPDLIESRVVKCPVTGCWNWQRGKDSYGYGFVKVGGHQWGAHRASYTIFRGPIPDGLWVLHTCDNRACCNPAHLWLGTNDDNVADRDKKGRTLKGEEIGNSKLTEEQVLAIRVDPRSNQMIGDSYNVSGAHVSFIKRRLKWKHL